MRICAVDQHSRACSFCCTYLRQWYIHVGNEDSARTRYHQPDPAPDHESPRKRAKKMHLGSKSNVSLSLHWQHLFFGVKSNVRIQGSSGLWQRGLLPIGRSSGCRCDLTSFLSCIMCLLYTSADVAQYRVVQANVFDRLRTKALSVKQCSGIAAGFKSDGVRGHAIKQFAKRHAERDMFRWKLFRIWDRCHYSLFFCSHSFRCLACFDMHCAWIGDFEIRGSSCLFNLTLRRFWAAHTGCTIDFALPFFHVKPLSHWDMHATVNQTKSLFQYILQSRGVVHEFDKTSGSHC